jgi:hypothetical protein
MFNVDITASGPLFDGRAEPAVDDFLRDAEDDVATEGVEMVGDALHAVLRNPTGYYESQLGWERVGSHDEVYGDKVIYGAWLEGVGSRNAPVTRFPGYFTFRSTTPLLQESVVEILERSALPKLMHELDG